MCFTNNAVIIHHNINIGMAGIRRVKSFCVKIFLMLVAKKMLKMKKIMASKTNINALKINTITLPNGEVMIISSLKFISVCLCI